jgi:hypothetical protein
MKFFPLIWSNLRRRKLRTALTLLSVLVAFVLFGYLSAIGRALDQGVSVAGADRLVARHRVTITQLLPESYQARIARIAGVEAPWLPMPRSRELARLGASFVERFAQRVGFTPVADPVTVEMAQCFWYLDASKAERELGWRTAWSVSEAVGAAARWYAKFYRGAGPDALLTHCRADIAAYCDAAARSGAAWAASEVRA